MKVINEVTINWHINEACNFGCNYCYAKWSIEKSPFRRIYPTIIHQIAGLAGQPIFVLPYPLTAIKIRLNFAGGEPFLMRDLGNAVTMAAEAGLSPSFISNGVLVSNRFIEELGSFISVAGFSFDSFLPDTMRRIGRAGRNGDQLTEERLNQIFELFRKVSPKTVLKINTVVCEENVDENLCEGLFRLRPDRWKMLRVIPGHGGVPISDERFTSFVMRHQEVPNGVVEDNEDMRRSYLMINPDGRFYQRDGSSYLYGPPILEGGAAAALAGIEFDADAYLKRY